MQTLSYVVRRLIDWLCTRARPVGRRLIALGASILGLVFSAPWIMGVAIDGTIGSWRIRVGGAEQDPLPGMVVLVPIALSVLLVGVGLIMEISHFRHDRRRRERQLVVVIEQRGLGITADAPLAAAVPAAIAGHRDPLIIDIRERLHEGAVIAPQEALKQILMTKPMLASRVQGRDSADVAIVYGGLMPVPFTFLTGMLLDDESQITVLDWDRDYRHWRELDSADDGTRFEVMTLPDQIEGEVVLAVSISYAVDLPRIERAFAGLPIIHLRLAHPSTDQHWSLDKQIAWAKAFRAMLQALDQRGSSQVHLIIAAPNSVVFRLGASFDRRNLAPAIVYQYERATEPAYPWGVRLPTRDVPGPHVVWRAANASDDKQSRDEGARYTIRA